LKVVLLGFFVLGLLKNLLDLAFPVKLVAQASFELDVTERFPGLAFNVECVELTSTLKAVETNRRFLVQAVVRSVRGAQTLFWVRMMPVQKELLAFKIQKFASLQVLRLGCYTMGIHDL